jgi:hypothetical protein
MDDARRHTPAHSPLAVSTLRYLLTDLDGADVGTIERERPLEQDEVLVLDGQRWRVMNTIGVSGHVTRA